MRVTISVVCVLAALFVLPALAAMAQQVDRDQLPPEVLRELDRRGITPEEALQEARMLGIDLRNPEQARRRARELGIPEAQLRLWTRLAEAADRAQVETDRGIDASRRDRRAPVLAGRAEVIPDEVIIPRRLQQSIRSAIRDADRRLDQDAEDDRRARLQQEQAWWLRDAYENRLRIDGREPATTSPWEAEADSIDPSTAIDSVYARVPLQDHDSGVRDVSLLLIDEMATDTLRAVNVRRVLGSTIEGVWQGVFYIPPTIQAGEWTLKVIATDFQENEGILATGAILTVLSEDDPRPDPAEEEELAYFGYDIFEQARATFDPGGATAADDGYLISPGDELRLIMWGASELQYDLQVDLEGRVFVPTVGQFTVAGRRLGQLRTDMRNWLSRNYAGLTGDPPTVFMDLTVTRLRPSQVYVLGEVERPGGYTLPSGSSVFNALYRVGGPKTSGSLRDIRIVRNGQVVARVDLYEFLLQGSSSEEVKLQSNDYIFVPPREKTVTVDGEVRRPAIYELRRGESVADLIEYAGGLKAEAYTRRFHIERVVPFEQRNDPSVARTVVDESLADVLNGSRSIGVEDGDIVTIFSIVDRTSAAGRSRVPAVNISGAVFSPGQYELNDRLRTVRDLIEAADGITGDAYIQQAELIRLGEDLESEVISLDLEQVMEDEPTHNLVLRPQDSLQVFSNLDLRADRIVQISGMVLHPGEYQFHRNMTVQDLLFKGGGLEDPEFLKEVFLGRADLFRQSEDGRTEEIIPFDLGAVLNGEDDFGGRALRPQDEIRIYPARVERLEQRSVTVSGAVNNPGEFRYFDGMTLEDVLLQAEGFREDAYMMEVEITRPSQEQRPRPATFGNPSSSNTSESRVSSMTVSLLGADSEGRFQFAADDTVAAMSEARTFELLHRDRIFVRPNPDYEVQRTVRVAGEVRFPGEYTLLHENETLGEVLQRAGGVRPSGHLQGGRLMRDDEQVIVEMDRALRGDRRRDVVLHAGDEIFIPPQPNTVAVRGNVANDGQLRFERGRRVSYYLERAGGLRDRTEAIYLTQPSGATYRVQTGWFRSTPIVEDGAIIVAVREPERDGRDGVDVRGTLTDVTAILSSMLTILVLSRRAFD